MTHAALLFALSAALLVGALLTLGGAIVAADHPRWSTDLGIAPADLEPLAIGTAAFGLLTFIAAASAIGGA
ncbi:hypothetical protein [Sphingomonas panni]|uniref:hypothetical protein n=1 Tax=Sphingomonas panni TaxID=237612 RepID=UPI001F5B7208|nr:hypothetical protein [Sphingomonas panni]